MGNTVDKMRQRELDRRATKRGELVAFLEGTKRRQSLLELNGQFGGDEAQNLHLTDPDRPMGITRAQLLGAGQDEDGDHRLTDREREAWLYRMENEALEVINDNMELQEERRRERERREERRDELENMGLDMGVGGDPDQQGDDPNAHRDEMFQQEDRSPVSSRRSSLVASDDVDDDDDDFASDGGGGGADDDYGYDMDDDADAGGDDGGVDDAASDGAPESDRGEPEPAAEEAGGDDDEERRLREH